MTEDYTVWIFLHDGYVATTAADRNAHAEMLALAGHPTNRYTETRTRTIKDAVPAQGENRTVDNGVWTCTGCGATK